MFIRNVFFTFSTEIFAVGATFLTGVILARTLTPADRGVMVLVMTLPWVVASFAHLGLSQANIYMVGRKKYDAALVLGNALVLAIITGLLAVIILNPFRTMALQTILKDLPPPYWLPLILLVPVLLIDMVPLSILRARQRFDLTNLRQVGYSVALFGGFVIVLVLGRGGLTAAASVYITVTIVMVILSLLLVKKVAPLTFNFNRQLSKASLQFGLKSYVQNLVGVLNYRLDVFLLAYYLAPEQVAFYGVATGLAEIAWYFPDSVGMVLFPRLSSVPEEDVHHITARVCRDTLTITGVIIVGLLAVSWLFVPLIYGAVYRASVLPLLILLPGVMAMGLYKVLTRNFTSRNRQQVSTLASGMALILNIGLNVTLIPRWGVAGAAVASTVGYTVAGGMLLIFFLIDAKLPWHEVLLPKRHELVGHLYWAKERLQGQRQRVKMKIKEG